MATKTIKRRVPKSTDSINVNHLANEFEETKSIEKRIKTRLTKMRDQLVDIVKSQGSPDDKGHLWVELSEDTEQGSSSIKYERRASQVFDIDKAEEFLENKGLLGECQVTITVLDESKVLRLFQEDKLTEEEIDSLYKVSESWALKIV